MTNGNQQYESMETAMGTHSLTREQRAQRVLKDELTKKLDHILYTEWDPIGVHFLDGFECFDEYHSYLPTLVDMVRDGASLTDISDQLMEFENYMLGDKNIRRRCDVIAVLVSSYGPHYSENPFMPIVNTHTPESAYQSVLDLVTQTRLDAYENRWDDVRIGYEKVIDICLTHLPERDGLLGACLNNLGHAYRQLGQLDKAQAEFKKALTKLVMTNHSLVSLSGARISVEGDGGGLLPSTIIID